MGIGAVLLINGLLWIWMLKPLRESDNDLKKVMKNFPINLVLKNPRLRMFIFKTSSNNLDAVKNRL